jgi:hypothetical protein
MRQMLREHTMDDHVDFALTNEALEKIQTVTFLVRVTILPPPPSSELTNNACAQVATENEKIHETSIQLLYLFQVQKKFVQAVRTTLRNATQHSPPAWRYDARRTGTQSRHGGNTHTRARRTSSGWWNRTGG